MTQLAARVHEGTVGARSAEVAALHPPTITLSLSLGNVSVPGLLPFDCVLCLLQQQRVHRSQLLHLLVWCLLLFFLQEVLQLSLWEV